MSQRPEAKIPNIPLVEEEPQAEAAEKPAPEVPAPQPPRPQPPKIAGASGEFAAVARRAARQAVPLSEEAAYYSRYNKRYTNPDRAVSGLGQGVVVRTTIKEPAYVWLPFLAYGVASVAAALAWCLVASLATAAPLDPSGTFMAAGLAVLCSIVFCGVVLAVATAAVSLQRDERLVASDVVAVAVGKTALMMVLGLLAWVLCAAVAMM